MGPADSTGPDGRVYAFSFDRGKDKLRLIRPNTGHKKECEEISIAVNRNGP